MLTTQEDASVWGYRAGSTPEAPWEPIAGASPMHLQLMGQPVPHAPLEIPDKLSNIITIHEKLPYPEYYRLLSNAVRTTFMSRACLVPPSVCDLHAHWICIWTWHGCETGRPVGHRRPYPYLIIDR